jgi:phosphatidylglycerol:prolipoprotein diacylglycerol transferase
MRPVLFHLGDFAISSFWTMAFLGFFLAFLVARSDVVRRGDDGTLAYDLVLYAYIGGWIGARVFLIPTGWHYLIEDPFAFLFSSAGWVWYGGWIGGALAILLWWWIDGRRYSFLVLTDISSAPLALGLTLGRLGCQLSGDGDYGIPTDLPWGMAYPNGVVPTTDRVHPTPVYEMIGNFAIFLYLWRRRSQPLPAGDQFGRYLILSSAVRFPVEFVRRNSPWLLGLTTAQWTAIAAAIVGAVILYRVRGNASARRTEDATDDRRAMPMQN